VTRSMYYCSSTAAVLQDISPAADNQLLDDDNLHLGGLSPAQMATTDVHGAIAVVAEGYCPLCDVIERDYLDLRMSRCSSKALRPMRPRALIPTRITMQGPPISSGNLPARG
jgi:hypothetical protein